MIIGHLDLPTDRIAAICQKYHVKELSIFGSALLDDFLAYSDIDLLVDLLPAHGLGLIDYLGCQEELAEALGRRVDLVQKSGLKRLVREEILRTQRIIYVRTDAQYLWDIIDAADAIDRFLIGKTLSAFGEDELLRAAIQTKLIIIGEAVTQLSKPLTDKYPQVPWQQIRGFRNAVIHGYFKIDWDILWKRGNKRRPRPP